MDAEQLSKILNKFYAPYPNVGHDPCVKVLLELFEAERKRVLKVVVPIVDAKQ